MLNDIVWFAFTVDLERDIPYRVDSYLGLEYVGQVLHLLRAYDARGTFFVSGDIAVNFSDVVREIHQAGHEVGCHGWNHEPYNNKNPQGLSFAFLDRHEKTSLIRKATQVILATCSDTPRSFRAPYLSYDRDLIRILNELSYNVDSSLRVPNGHLRPSKPFYPSIRNPTLEIPVHSGEQGISSTALRLAGQNQTRSRTQRTIESNLEQDLPSLIVFSCHPWEFVSSPPWRTFLPAYFSVGNNRLLKELDEFLEFLTDTYEVRFIRMQEIYRHFAPPLVSGSRG